MANDSDSDDFAGALIHRNSACDGENECNELVVEPESRFAYPRTQATKDLLCYNMRATKAKKHSRAVTSRSLADTKRTIDSLATSAPKRLARAIQQLGPCPQQSKQMQKYRRKLHNVFARWYRMSKRQRNYSSRLQDLDSGFDTGLRNNVVANVHGLDEKTVKLNRTFCGHACVQLGFEEVERWLRYCRGNCPLDAISFRRFDSASSRLELAPSFPSSVY